MTEIERIPMLDDVLQMLIDEGASPNVEALYSDYIYSLKPAARKAAELDYGETCIKLQIKDFLRRGLEERKYSSDIDSSIFFDESNRFVSKWLGDYILSSKVVKTMRDTEEMFYYEDGYYKIGAETLIKKIVTNLMGNATRKHYYGETIHYIQSVTYALRDEPPVNLLCLENGIYDIETGELKKHTPECFFINVLPILFDAQAVCPNVISFLKSVVTEEDMILLQEFIGYCLYRKYSIHKSFMLVGDGSNGKTTFLNMLTAFLGRKNISSVALQDLDTNRFSIANLYNRLANIYDDLPDRALRTTGKFKMVTGNAPLDAEKKFSNTFAFNNYAKMIFSCNKVPESVGDDSDAFFRRWIIINFPNTFIGETCDPNMIEKITSRQELSGLFNWAMEGLKRLLNQGRFSHSKSTDDIRKEYTKMSSPSKAFMDEHVLLDSEALLSKEDLYKYFVDYCHDNNLPTISKETFSKKVVENFGSSLRTERILEKGRRVYCWRGIKYFKEDFEDD